MSLGPLLGIQRRGVLPADLKRCWDRTQVWLTRVVHRVVLAAAMASLFPRVVPSLELEPWLPTHRDSSRCMQKASLIQTSLVALVIPGLRATLIPHAVPFRVLELWLQTLD